MALAVRYEVKGLKETTHKLLRFSERALDPEPVLWSFVDVLRGLEAKRFAAEGPGWAPLADSTIASKTEGDKIGEETKAMMESLTKEGAEGSLAEVVGLELHFGTNLTDEEGFPYPVVFDKGTKDGTQPARPLFDIKAADLRIFTKAVQTYLIGLDRAEGFGGSDRMVGSDVMPGLDSQIYKDF